MKQKDNNEIEKLLEKPKYIEMAIIGGISAILTAFAFYLFPDDTEFNTKLIVCLSILVIMLLILLVIETIKFNNFYILYKNQYNYFTNKIDNNNKQDKNIKKIKKDINNIKEQQKKSVWFEVEETWDE